MIGSAGQRRVPTEFFSKYMVPVFPLDEQDKIVSILDSQDKRIQKEQSYLNKLQQLKKGLMEDLLTGKVRVNELEEVQA